MAVSDADGIVYYRFVYDTYGELSDITTDDGVSIKSSEQLTEYRLAELAHATGIDYLYNGQYGVETDQNGLYYMRARYYNQDIKRFINRDVVSGDISNSQSLNRYCYVQGNPVSLTDPFGLCPDPNSNFKNFCKVLYYTDWNAVGHAALSVAGVFWDGADVANMFWYMAEGKMDKAAECAVFALPVMGSWAGSLFMKGSKTSKFGSTLKTVSQLTQGSVGIYCGVDMTVTGITNMLNSIDAGTINPEDVFMTVGGIAATAIWGKSVLPSGGIKRITNSISDAYKTRKANQLSELGKQGRLIDADISHAPVGGSTTSTADRIRSVAQRSFDYAVNNPRRLGLNRMQLGKDAEVQATRWTRKWAQRNGIDLSENGLRFQVRGEHSIPDVVYEPTKNVWDFKLTPKAVRKNQSKNFANDFVGYTVEYIFGPGPWRDG